MKQKALVLGHGTEIDWAFFEKSLHRKFGVNAVAYDGDGDRRTTGDIDTANDICYLIKNHLKGARQICAAIQSFMNHKARVSKRYVTEECMAGMYKIVVPVLQDDRIQGFVSTCGRPFISPERVYTNYIHHTIDAAEADIIALLSTLDPIDPRTIRAIIGYITSYS
jgi:ligand-binding sensor protein